MPWGSSAHITVICHDIFVWDPAAEAYTKKKKKSENNWLMFMWFLGLHLHSPFQGSPLEESLTLRIYSVLYLKSCALLMLTFK